MGTRNEMGTRDDESTRNDNGVRNGLVARIGGSAPRREVVPDAETPDAEGGVQERDAD